MCCDHWDCFVLQLLGQLVVVLLVAGAALWVGEKLSPLK
jgi:hypothetical protein